jgi:hypothetical protein
MDKSNWITAAIASAILIVLIGIAWLLMDARNVRIAAERKAEQQAIYDKAKADLDKRMKQVEYDIEFKAFLEGRGPDPMIRKP